MTLICWLVGCERILVGSKILCANCKREIEEVG